MGKGTKWYSEEFKNTIVELYNSGKTLTELNSEYGIAKSTISGWIKKASPVSIDKDTTIIWVDYQAILKKMAKLEEENEILKKAIAIFTEK
jgi:transposase